VPAISTQSLFALHFAVFDLQWQHECWPSLAQRRSVFKKTSWLQVESAVATVDGSSDDLHKCATAINDLAYKVCGLSCGFAQQCVLCKGCCA